MSSTHIVIMAGGLGSRLYPLSTPEHPKQFLDLLGVGKSLIRTTFERLMACCPGAHIWVSTSESYLHFVREQLPEVPSEQIICEPVRRNTAPSLSLACRKICHLYPDAVIIATPTDAHIPDPAAFAMTMLSAIDYTEDSGAILCVGIVPDHPETEYGYIKTGEVQSGSIVKVLSFKEKPSLVTAQRYLGEGGYFWNAGIFIFKASTFMEQMRIHAPELEETMDSIEGHLFSDSEAEALSEHFPKCDNISIDYALMEKSDRVYMIPGEWKWFDLGSHAAISASTR